MVKQESKVPSQEAKRASRYIQLSDFAEKMFSPDGRFAKLQRVCILIFILFAGSLPVLFVWLHHQERSLQAEVEGYFQTTKLADDLSIQIQNLRIAITSGEKISSAQPGVPEGFKNVAFPKELRWKSGTFSEVQILTADRKILEYGNKEKIDVEKIGIKYFPNPNQDIVYFYSPGADTPLIAFAHGQRGFIVSVPPHFYTEALKEVHSSLFKSNQANAFEASSTLVAASMVIPKEIHGEKKEPTSVLFGSPVFSTDPFQLGEKELSEINQKFKDESVPFYLTQKLGIQRYPQGFGINRIQKTNLGLVILWKPQGHFGMSFNFLWPLVVMTLVCVCFLLTFIAMYSKGILEPLQITIDFLKQISQGNWSSIMELNDQNSHLSELVIAANEVAGRLQQEKAVFTQQSKETDSMHHAVVTTFLMECPSVRFTTGNKLTVSYSNTKSYYFHQKPFAGHGIYPILFNYFSPKFDAFMLLFCFSHSKSAEIFAIKNSLLFQKMEGELSQLQPQSIKDSYIKMSEHFMLDFQRNVHSPFLGYSLAFFDNNFNVLGSFGLGHWEVLTKSSHENTIRITKIHEGVKKGFTALNSDLQSAFQAMPFTESESLFFNLDLASISLLQGKE